MQPSTQFTTLMQSGALLMLRVTVGMFFIWWGIARILYPDAAVGLSEQVYLGLFAHANWQVLLGWSQAALGLCIALGIARRIILAMVLGTSAFSAILLWQSWLDPFAFWLTGAGTGRLHDYPTIIVFACAAVLLAFLKHDNLCMDRLRHRIERPIRTELPNRLTLVPGGLSKSS